MEDFRRRGHGNFPHYRRSPLRTTGEEPNFIPLTKSPSVIIEQIRRKEFFQAPQPMRTTADKRDRSRYCQYHASVSHHIDQCISLKYFLESLVKRNLLGEYLQPPRRNAHVPALTLALNAPLKHIVDMIVDGLAPPINLQQVLHIEQSAPTFRFPNMPISFSNEDYPQGDECCFGPLTVQLDISGQHVRKVLIDNGSSVDNIFRHTLRRMILGGHVEEKNIRISVAPCTDSIIMRCLSC